MTETLYKKQDGGVVVKNADASWGVDIPAYVYDIWNPLLKPHGMNVLGMLRRLSREGRVKGLTLKDLAAACGMSNKTFAAYAKLLKNCGFIKMKTPNEQERKEGVSTVFECQKPPDHVSAEMIKLLTGDHPERYKPVVAWLFEKDEAPEDPEWDEIDPPEEEAGENEPPKSLVSIDTCTGVNLHEAGCQSTASSVLIDTISIDPLLVPSILDQSQFLGPEIRDSGQDADDPISGDDPVQTQTVTVKVLDGPDQPNALSPDQWKAEIARRQGGVAGKANPNAEERSVNMKPRKAVAAKTNANLPDVCQLAIRSLHAVQARTDSKFTDEQIGELTTMPIRLHSGEIMDFTVADLYTQHRVEFDAWVMGLPAVLKAHNHRLTPANMVKYMRSYDMNVVGFVAFMAAKGNFGLTTGPKHEVVVEPTFNPYNPEPVKIIRRGDSQ